MAEKVINIGGRFHDTSSNHTVTGANEILDDDLQKKQSVINADTYRKNEVYNKEETNNIISRTPETDVIVIDIPAASQDDIAGWLDANTPSGIDPETGRSVRANKLYRVPGPTNTTYSEWAWDGTKYIPLANKDYGIDNTPQPGSDNMSKSGGNWEFTRNMIATTEKSFIIDETPTGGWTVFNEVLEGWYLVEYEGSSEIDIRLYKIPYYSPTSADIKTIAFRNGKKRALVNLTREYTRYVVDDASGRVKITFTPLKFSVLGVPFNYDDFSVGTIHEGYIVNDTIETESYGNWRYSTYNTVVGHLYVVVSNCSSDYPVVGISDDGLSVNCKYSNMSTAFTNQENISITSFVAKTNIVGFNSFKGGSGMDYEGFYRIIDITAFVNEKGDSNRLITDFGEMSDIKEKLFRNLNWAKPATIVQGSFYDIFGNLMDATGSNWKTAKIDTVAGHWYIIRCSVMNNVRIVDIDGDGNTSINPSVCVARYNEFNTSNRIMVLVRAKDVKLGVSGNYTDEMLADFVYFDIDASDNFLIGKLFTQALMETKALIPDDMNGVSSFENGFFADDGTIETHNYGSWRYKIIDVTPGQWYLLRCPIFRNIRVVDIDENDNISFNQTIPQSYYNSRSTDDDTYVAVKAKYTKMGFSFRENKSFPQYCRISEDSLIKLFMQMYDIVGSAGSKTVIVDKSGGGDYTSFAEAVIDNYGKQGITLQLRPGNYDLFSELAAYYGTDDFLPLTKYGRGLELGYGITIEGCPNAVIKADYLGSDADIMTYFSPLNTTKEVNGGGFTLRGVNIRCSRVRYCVHDEKTAAGTGAYTNIYEACNFYIDNRNNTAWSSAQCIGGGLGTSGNIIVRNSIFESLSTNLDGEVVSWHNNANAGAKSMISCTDNYIKGNGGFRFSWYGQSTEITEVICTGNNVGKATVLRAETVESSNLNMALYDWNNTVRS